MECYTCLATSGERRISPGPTIYRGRYWLVEHTHPTGIKGWLVVAAQMRVESLHEMTADEFAELGPVLGRTTSALQAVVGCQKEYVACYAEGDHFHHVHFHVVARAPDLPSEFIGPKIFGLLNVDESVAIPAAEIEKFCRVLQK